MDQQQATTVPQPTVLDVTRVNKRRKLLGIWLLIGPSILIAGTILLFAITHYIGKVAYPGFDETTAIYGAPTLGGMLVNLAILLAGFVGVLLWLPCLIAGIVILAAKKRVL